MNRWRRWPKLVKVEPGPARPRKFSGWQYHVVNLYGSRSRATHVVKCWGRYQAPALGMGIKHTLCGQSGGRYVPVFQPGEVSCRECRRRYEIAVPRAGRPSDGPGCG